MQHAPRYTNPKIMILRAPASGVGGAESGNTVSDESEQRARGRPVQPRQSDRPLSLHDAIVTRVREMIIEGALALGTRSHEGQLG